MSSVDGRIPAPDTSPYAVIQASPQFQELKRRHRSFTFPLAVGFLVWYFIYVLLAAYAPAFMATKVIGTINIGLIMGLLQFVSTFAITALYIRFANNTMDPLVENIKKAHAEDEAARGEHGEESAR